MDDGGKNVKRYGLICPKKTGLSAPKAINVFGNEQESEDEDGTDWVKKALKAEGEKIRAKRQTRLNIEKAMLQDPTVCQYDEVFDDMKRREECVETKNHRVKKPKYIENLLKTAERRKREQEHRIERTVQKEREAEGAAFADKDSFVTSAYRAKLEEFKQMERDQENTDRLESIGDVTKQQDMSGFYRHLFHQTVANEKTSTDAVENLDADRDDRSDVMSEQSSDRDATSRTETSDARPRSPKNKRQVRRYRQRTTQDSESEVEEAKSDKEAADVSDEEKMLEDKGLEPAEKKAKESSTDGKSRRESHLTGGEKSTCEAEIVGLTASEKPCNENTKKENDRVGDEEGKKKKVSIWEKRTIGPVFEAALQRYYARKAVQLSGS